jgi:non-ribosomal peptide synthase protein (TIGR01720 family)
VPASDLQRLVLAEPADRDWDNVSLVFTVAEPLDQERLAGAATEVLSQHESLRVRLVPDGAGSWTQEPVESGSPAVAETGGGTVADWLIGLHRSMDLTAGLVFRVGQHSRGDEHRLAVIAHHAVADMVSLQVVVSDLLQAYEQLSAGDEVLGVARPTPAEMQPAASTPEQRAEWRAWLTDAASGAGQLPVDRPAGAGTHAHERGVEQAHGALAGRLVAAARTIRVNPLHLLLVAVGGVVAGETGRDAALVDVVGGRGGADGSALTEAVGNLAAATPVRLPTGDDVAARARAAQAALSSPCAPAPAYAALRLEADLDRHLLPQVQVNYLGRVTEALPPPLLAVESHLEAQRGPGRGRDHEFEVIGVIRDAQLHLSLRYSADRYAEATAAGLLDRIVEELTAAIQAVEDGAGTAPTPQDFPLAGLGQESLDLLSRQLAGNTGGGER